MRATQFEFVNWDDNTYVTDNAQVLGGLTARSVVWAFTTTHAPYWHPVNWLSHILDVELFGLDAGGHHLTSVAIHLANTVLLFVLLLLLDVWPLRRLGGDPDDRVGWRRALAEKLPLLALAVAVGVGTLVQTRVGAVAGLDLLSWQDRVANAVVSYAGYLWKTFWPAGLAAFTRIRGCQRGPSPLRPPSSPASRRRRFTCERERRTSSSAGCGTS